MKNKKHNNIMNFCEKNKNNQSIEFVYRGCAIRNRQDKWFGFVSSIKIGEDNSYLIFEEEPSNRYDPNAIMVVCRGEFFGTMGYVGREYTGRIKEILEKCKAYHIDMIDENEKGEKEIKLLIQWIE